MIVNPPYPVKIAGALHAPHPRFGFPMWKTLGGEWVRCNKSMEQLEQAVATRDKRKGAK